MVRKDVWKRREKVKGRGGSKDRQEAQRRLSLIIQSLSSSHLDSHVGSSWAMLIAALNL